MSFKALVTFFALSIVSSSAFAQFFPAQAYVAVLPGQVRAEVFNPHYEPIVCEGYVFGRTYRGMVLNAFFRDFIPGGSHRFAFVYTNPYDPFMNGWSNIHCHFARY